MILVQVWTWGEPWGEFSMQLDRSPRAVPDATDVAKIACGAFHNLALTRCNVLTRCCGLCNTQYLIVAMPVSLTLMEWRLDSQRGCSIIGPSVI